ncbi:hypothetical protein F5Y14DRAFT_451541 [Nemania sp. NC0429]|nr:hypothetical protein F5Y14DRAFT_451541 [Nemania sp. NC0429]
MATIYQDLRDLFYNPQYSDLEIVCRDGEKFKVHRVVIALHSPLLNRMITDYRDDNGQVISRIELPDVEFNTLYMVLQFLYGGDYTDYENIGGFHSPSYVIFMTLEEMEASLETLPCLNTDSITDGMSIDDDDDYDDGDESKSPESEDEDTDEELDDAVSDSDSDSDSNSESSGSQDDEWPEDQDRDDRRTRRFQGHNLFDSLNVYRVATRFNIVPLRLLARDRFYRTAEKVLMLSRDHGDRRVARWWTHDHQRIYRSELAKAIFNDFPRVVDELYKTVSESDTMMRAIPPMLIAAGYNDDGFRNHVKPLLEKYPDLALAVVECMRVPHSQE